MSSLLRRVAVLAVALLGGCVEVRQLQLTYGEGGEGLRESVLAAVRDCQCDRE